LSSNVAYDVIVVGAGIAGTTCAIALARSGYRILLVDRSTFPREKPCGEGIMPQGVNILSELGLLPDILAHGGARIRGMRYRSRKGTQAQADFPAAANGASFGVVMRRYDLDHLLVDKAKAYPNITVREGFRVTDVIQTNELVHGIAGRSVQTRSPSETFSAPVVVGADGRHSIFHKSCRLTKKYFPRKRFGVTSHFHGVERLGAYVEVQSHSEGEIYIAPSTNGICLVAALLEKRAMRHLQGRLSTGYMSFLSRLEGFGERIAASERISPVLAAGPLGFTVQPCYRPGLILIGDSAGFLDPITGDGMTLALKSVKAAVPLIEEAFTSGDFGEKLGARYAEQRLILIDDIWRFTRLLLSLTRYKFIADRAVCRLSRDQQLFEKLLGVISGRQRYADLSLQEKAVLLMG
jgi:2-polyprenyl-6-methoxyphenol hydroxylase-like FAD-dependent oxidoreductase